MPVITRTTPVECTPKEVFQFLTKPSNLVSVSPTLPSLFFHSPNLLLGKGQIIHFDLSYGLFRVSWTSKITRFEPYSLIEDTLQSGPLKRWVHRQEFEPHDEGTRIHDSIDFDVGMGPLGMVMEKLVVSYQVQNYLKERAEKTTEKIRQVKRHVA